MLIWMTCLLLKGLFVLSGSLQVLQVIDQLYSKRGTQILREADSSEWNIFQLDEINWTRIHLFWVISYSENGQIEHAGHSNLPNMSVKGIFKAQIIPIQVSAITDVCTAKLLETSSLEEQKKNPLQW